MIITAAVAMSGVTGDVEAARNFGVPAMSANFLAWPAGGEEFLGQLIARHRRPVVFDRVARGRLTVRAEQQFGAVAGDAEA